jgi:hypothetical protein
MNARAVECTVIGARVKASQTCTSGIHQSSIVEEKMNVPKLPNYKFL